MHPAFKGLPILLWLLLPFYLVLVFCLSVPELQGDEGRYLEYAENITHGFYTDAENPSIRNGPAYPLFLTPFAYWDAPYVLPRLCNAFFLFVAIVFLHRTLLLMHVPRKAALGFSLFLGLYPPLLLASSMILTEALTVLLLCLIPYHLVRTQHGAFTFRHWLSGAFIFGLLALTKVIFFHVFLASLLALGLLYLLRRPKYTLRVMTILAGGILFFLPFLVHTYQLTGKPFYSGTQGGAILYFRATPFEGEYGDWFSEAMVLDVDGIHDRLRKGGDLGPLKENHGDFYRHLQGMTEVQKDSAFKSMAWQYMQSHPIKYLENTVANVGRLFFNYPLSYRQQTLATYLYLAPNIFIVVAFFSCVLVALTGRRKLPLPLLYTCLLSGIYLGAMVFLIGRARHLVPALPAILLLVAFASTRLLRIQWRHLE